MTDSRFVWLELATGNVEAVKDFYSALFAWKAREEGGAAFFMLGEDSGASLVPAAKAKDAGWLPFVGVADIKAATTKAVKLGATVIQDVTETPHGYRSVVLDPAGTRLALFEPKA